MPALVSLVSALHDVQKRHGYLPNAELISLAERRPDWPLHRLHEVASFFPHFRLEPSSALEVRVCRDMACHLRGAPELKRALEELVTSLGQGKVHIEGVSCLGQCDAAPAVAIGEHVFRGATAARCGVLIQEALAAPESFHAPHRTDGGIPTGWRIDPYHGREDYGAVRKFVAEGNADALVEALKVADLRGMGGAGVWAHQKWSDVRRARGETKYIVCNADESEPTTFKDRELLFRTPHLVLEGVILGGLLVGAESGFIYIRHEYEEQIEAMRSAIARAEQLGVCGQNVLSSRRAFPVEVFVSPGGYICGEQSALIEAMEGKRAEPRNKPPLLETNGLFDKPTLLSNVETFAWVPAITVRGGDWYRDLGIRGYKGARFFSICGDVARPGAYEVPNGITLRELIDEHAGGMRGGTRLKAFAPSGPSGGFLPARLPRSTLARGFEKRVPERFLAERLPETATHLDTLDLELDLQLFRDLGLMLGAGMMVYGEQTRMIEQALNASEFFRNESCGKCVPCRIGSRKTVELARGLEGRSLNTTELTSTESLLGEIRRAMELTSICGLGMVAGNPVATVFQHFREELGQVGAPGGPR
jgi:NADH:ubiquinone oxidoreductase subunit F (NADH-binding)/NADH:ubiquinone oxidoreductase subunit E